jgi:hypothetical protein
MIKERSTLGGFYLQDVPNLMDCNHLSPHVAIAALESDSIKLHGAGNRAPCCWIATKSLGDSGASSTDSPAPAAIKIYRIFVVAVVRCGKIVQICKLGANDNVVNGSSVFDRQCGVSGSKKQVCVGREVTPCTIVDTVVWKIGKIAEDELRPLGSAVFENAAKFLSIVVKNDSDIDWWRSTCRRTVGDCR